MKHRAGLLGLGRATTTVSDRAHQPGDAEVEQRPAREVPRTASARRLAVPREGGQRERPAIVPVRVLDARCD
jgi:hypothetical protein